MVWQCATAFLILLWTFPVHGSDPERVYAKASGLLRSKDHAAMTRLLDSLRTDQLDPTGSRILHDLLHARHLRYRGAYREAYAIVDSLRFDTATAAPILTYSLYAQRAKLLKRMEWFPEAIEAASVAAATARHHGLTAYLPNMVLLLGDAHQHEGRHEQALALYEEGLELTRLHGDRELECVCILSLGNLHYRREEDADALARYREAMACAERTGDRGTLLDASLNTGAALSYTDGPQAAIAHYEDLLRGSTLREDPALKADVLLNLAGCWSDLDDHRKALPGIDEAIAAYRSIADTSGIVQALLVRSTALRHLDRISEALAAAEQAHALGRSLSTRVSTTQRLAELLHAMGRPGEAYARLNEYAQLKDSLDRGRFNDRLAMAQVRFRTAEQERRIAEQEQALALSSAEHRRKRIQRNLSLAVAGALLIAALLLWRSLRARRRLAEQQRQLHEKQVDQLLHQQEIKAINAMLEGQEKERDRLATELHDRLGSMLSTIKHQLDAVEGEVRTVHSEQNAHYRKVGHLLDEAVGEVRRISHDMVNVTLARFGLAKALEDLCESVRINGRLEVELKVFGLEQRLQRALEIAVYRMVQELVGNVLKHARARELTISVTRGPGRLSVIVSDDGGGFDPRTAQGGIGLDNVRARAAAIGATVQVDSAPGKGTTVSVEAPVVE